MPACVLDHEQSFAGYSDVITLFMSLIIIEAFKVAWILSIISGTKCWDAAWRPTVTVESWCQVDAHFMGWRRRPGIQDRMSVLPDGWSQYFTASGIIVIGLTVNQKVVGLTPGRVAIKWLLLGWVTVCGQVNHLGI